MVDLAGDPQAVHEHGELASEGHDRLAFADTGDEAFCPGLEGGVDMGAEVGVGGLDEEAADVGVTFLGDPSLAHGCRGGAQRL